MLAKKIKLIERQASANGVMEPVESYEERINAFLSTIESHHVKNIRVEAKFASIEYV